MKLSEELDAIKAHADGLEQLAKSLRDRLRHAQDSWPDHQIIPTDDWRTRDETPPAGKVWASNGTAVWLISCDGDPIGRHATAVLYWTTAYIPAPPDFSPRHADQKRMTRRLLVRKEQ